MADIELVIKIPEEVKQIFDCVKSNDLKGGYYDNGGVIGTAIMNGTPLPKGHGGMIDIDALLSNIEVKAFLSQDDMHLITIDKVKEAIDTAPIIVEPE